MSPDQKLEKLVKEYEKFSGCERRKLGFVNMPTGYALMLNADCTHYFYLRYNGGEGAIHWDRWAIYRWAKEDSTRHWLRIIEPTPGGWDI